MKKLAFLSVLKTISTWSFIVSILLLLIMFFGQLSRNWIANIGFIWLLLLIISFFSPLIGLFFKVEIKPSLWLSAGAFVEFIFVLYIILEAYGSGFQ